MNRREFIDKLRGALSKLPAEEREAAVEYYEEYFEDAGPENEAALIEELGSPKKLANQIRSEYAVRIMDEDPKPSVKKGASAVWWIVLGICSVPVSVPMAASLAVLVICGFVLVVCIILTVFLLLFAAALVGVVGMVIGILALPVSVSTGLLFLGAGAAILAVTAALGAVAVLGVGKAVRGLVGVMREKNEKRRLKKLSLQNGSEQWKYREEALDAAKEVE